MQILGLASIWHRFLKNDPFINIIGIVDGPDSGLVWHLLILLVIELSDGKKRNILIISQFYILEQRMNNRKTYINIYLI